MGTTTVVSGDDNRCLRFLQRHPQLHLALAPAIVGAYLLVLCWLLYFPPEFSATVSRSEGLLDPNHAEGGAPTFGVTLRARNRGVWRHCFRPGNGSAVVAYAGVPLARADLPGFCVPGRGAAKVRFVAAGEGLGMPGALYERLEAQRGRRERVPVTVRVRLDEEDLVVPHNVPVGSPMLLWCEAMLDGHPLKKGPSRCSAFGMAKS